MLWSCPSSLHSSRGAEVLVFGSGLFIRPPAPELVKELQGQGVGLEVSNTVRLPDPTTSQHARPSTLDTRLSAGVTLGAADACEVVPWDLADMKLGQPAQVNAIATFNILAQEGRHVVGAFVPMMTET